MEEQTDQLVQPGTLYIASEVLQQEKWIIDQVLAAAKLELRKHIPLDGYLRPTGVRSGDFALVISSTRIGASVVDFIGIPGRQRPAIVQQMYVTT